MAKSLENKLISVLHEWPQSRDSFHLGGLSRYLKPDSSLEDIPSLRNHGNHCSHPHCYLEHDFYHLRLLSWGNLHTFLCFPRAQQRQSLNFFKNPIGIFKQYFTKVSKHHQTRGLACDLHIQYYGRLDSLFSNIFY